MKLSKLLPLALALLLSVLSAHAEETGMMTIKTTDGKSIDIKMMDGMKGCQYYSSEDEIHERFVILTGNYKYDGSKLELDTLSSRPGVIHFEAPIINMTSITFSALDPAGVESVEKSPIQIDLAGGTISFSGVDSPISLIISDMGGTTLVNTEIKTDTTVDLTEYGHGVYVVNIGGKPFKILVK